MHTSVYAVVLDADTTYHVSYDWFRYCKPVYIIAVERYEPGVYQTGSQSTSRL